MIINYLSELKYLSTVEKLGREVITAEYNLSQALRQRRTGLQRRGFNSQLKVSDSNGSVVEKLGPRTT